MDEETFAVCSLCMMPMPIVGGGEGVAVCGHCDAPCTRGGTCPLCTRTRNQASA